MRKANLRRCPRVILPLCRFCIDSSRSSVLPHRPLPLLLCSSHQGHQLHFDLDERRAAAGRGLIHPLLSTVLFLSEPQQQWQQQQQEEEEGAATAEEEDPSPQPTPQSPTGNERVGPSLSSREDESPAVIPSGSGATLVTSQRLGDFTSGLNDETAEDQQGEGRCSSTDEGDCSRHSAWLVHPKKNRLLIFDGSLLHGVLPPSTSDSSSAASTLLHGSRDGSIRAGDADGCFDSRRTKADSPDRRITLMMAWHRDTAQICDDETRTSPSVSKEEDTEKDGTSTRVMGPLRKLSCNDPWVEALSERRLFCHQPKAGVDGDSSNAKGGQSKSYHGTAEGQWWVPEELGPLWVDLRTSGVADGDEQSYNKHSQQATTALGGENHAGPGVDGLRFFLRSLKDLDRLYLHGGSSM